MDVITVELDGLRLSAPGFFKTSAIELEGYPRQASKFSQEQKRTRLLLFTSKGLYSKAVFGLCFRKWF